MNVANFLETTFCNTFSYTIYKQFFNILATQNKIFKSKMAISDKRYEFLKFSLFDPFRLKCSHGEIFFNCFVFAHSGTLKPFHWPALFISKNIEGKDE